MNFWWIADRLVFSHSRTKKKERRKKKVCRSIFKYVAVVQYRADLLLLDLEIRQEDDMEV